VIDADMIQKGVEVAAYVIAGASAVAAVFPNPKVNAVLLILRKIVDCLAINVGNAKNAKPEQKDQLK